jgi:hypothetical protein
MEFTASSSSSEELERGHHWRNWKGDITESLSRNWKGDITILFGP